VDHDSQRIVKNEDYVVVKCAKWDFTIIPYLLFVLKFLSIIVRTNNRHMYVNELILYIYAVLCLLAFIVAPLLNKLVRRLNPKEERTDSFMEGVD
jgi:Na+/H+-dicarboxylate symporter